MISDSSPARYALLGTVIMLAVLMAGCTTGPSGAPQTPVKTVTTTLAPTSPAPLTTQVTPTSLPTAVAPAGNVTVPPMSPVTTPVLTLNQTPIPLPIMQITIQNYSFNPKTVTIPAGTTVTWTNLDIHPQQVSNSVTQKAGPGSIFLSPTLETNDTYSFTFNTTGVYQYFDTYYTNMVGTITVK